MFFLLVDEGARRYHSHIHMCVYIYVLIFNPYTTETYMYMHMLIGVSWDEGQGAF